MKTELAMTIHSAATPLLIKSVEAFGIQLPLNKIVLMAGVELRVVETLLIRIEAENGLIGWGEASSAPTHGGASLADMLKSFHDEMHSFLIGKNVLELSGLTYQLNRLAKNAKSTVAAVDVALFDLLGKHLGVPVHVLLGGAKRHQVPPLWLIGNSSIEKDLIEADKKWHDGYRFFKLKLGVKSLDDDIALTMAMREKFGSSLQMCSDANMGMNLEQATRYVQAVKDTGLAYLEQPLHKKDLAGTQALVKVSPIPIGLDESVTSVDDILQAAKDGLQGVSLKTLKLGGLSGVISAGHICEAFGLQINLASKMAETGIGAAALLHLSAVLPNVNWGVSPTHLYLAQDVVSHQDTPTNGFFEISSAPGLGVMVNEEVIQQHLAA
jgi:muconate cycloisomerase